MSWKDQFSALVGAIGADVKYLNTALGGRAPAALPTPATSVNTAARTARYDPARYLYNNTGANSLATRVGLARAASGGLYTITCIGDSKVAGYHDLGSSTTQIDGSLSWPGRLKKFLMGKYNIPDGGSGFVFCNLNNYGLTEDLRWANVNWPAFGANFVSGNPMAFTCYTTTVGATRTFTSDSPGTIVKAIAASNGGTCSITVDGVVPPNANVTVTNGTYSAGVWTPTNGNFLSTITISGLTNANHVVVFTNNTTTQFNIDCCGTFQTAGLIVQNAAISGSHSADWLQGNPPASNYYKALNVAMTAGGDEYIFSLGINDCRLSSGSGIVSAATFKANLTSLINVVNKPKTIVVPTPPSAAETPAATWNPYVSAMYDVAESLSCRLIDLGDAQGNSWANANTAGMMYDTVHENALGHLFDANVIANALALGAGGPTQYADINDAASSASSVYSSSKIDSLLTALGNIFAPTALTASNLPAKMVMYEDVTTTDYNTKPRPTSRTDIRVNWTAPDSSHLPVNALSGDYVDLTG